MSDKASQADRRKFLTDGVRVVGVATAGTLGVLLATRRGHAGGIET